MCLRLPNLPFFVRQRARPDFSPPCMRRASPQKSCAMNTTVPTSAQAKNAQPQNRPKMPRQTALRECRQNSRLRAEWFLCTARCNQVFLLPRDFLFAAQMLRARLNNARAYALESADFPSRRRFAPLVFFPKPCMRSTKICLDYTKGRTKVRFVAIFQINCLFRAVL